MAASVAAGEHAPTRSFAAVSRSPRRRARPRRALDRPAPPPSPSRLTPSTSRTLRPTRSGARRRWTGASAIGSALAPLLTLFALATPLAAQQPQHPLVALRLDDAAYVQLSSLERMGCDEARVSPYRPYEVRRVREALDRAGTNVRCAGPILDALRKRFAADTVAPLDTAGVAPDLAAAAAATAAMRGRPSRSGVDGAITLRLTGLGKGDFRPMWKGVQATDSGTPPFVGVLRLRATVDGGDNLVAVVGGYAESNRRNDPRVRMKRLRKSDAVLDFDDAYITGKLGLATITLGRGSEAWLGEGDESIALSAHGPPLDRIAASAVWKRLEGRALVATINDVTLDLALDSLVGEPPAQRYRRVLLGHALTYRHSPRVEFTIGETALLARTNTIFDLAYANPLMPYVFTQNDTSRAGTEARDNLQVFAATRFPLGPARVTGELLVDDIQIDPADRAVTPDQLAWRLAASTPVPLARPATAGVEYRHVNSYTYLRGQYTEVYQSYDAPLGSELGPDADLLRASLDLWLGGTTRVSFGVGSWRQGALRIFQRPAQSANFNAGRPYPTTSAERPAVQRALLGDVAVQMLRTTLPISLRVETARVDNAANQFALPAMYVRAQLIGSYAFRYP